MGVGVLECCFCGIATVLLLLFCLSRCYCVSQTEKRGGEFSKRRETERGERHKEEVVNGGRRKEKRRLRRRKRERKEVVAWVMIGDE